MRVSTGRQAEHDLSIPDQRRQLESWCLAQDYAVAAEFIESGASASDDRRPVFQQMIERACDGERAFELILVHSYSRFFREAFEQEFYLRKLAKHGVRVVSVTQPVGDESEPVQAMMRKVIALFDEYQSKENAKHVIRSKGKRAPGVLERSDRSARLQTGRGREARNEGQEEAGDRPRRSRDRSAHFQAVPTRGWHLRRARRQRGGQMAQPQWLSHPAR
jgi:DNA invertase Pin-like site-specific DNA recombinase